jgi:hypothetical protein
MCCKKDLGPDGGVELLSETRLVVISEKIYFILKSWHFLLKFKFKILIFYLKFSYLKNILFKFIY